MKLLDHWRIKRAHREARDLARQARWWWQRHARGFSDPDAWNAAWHWDRQIIAVLERMEGRWSGHPHDLTEEEWDQLCDFILVALRRVIRDEDGGYPALMPTSDIEAIYDDAEMAHLLLAKYWYDFWD